MALKNLRWGPLLFCGLLASCATVPPTSMKSLTSAAPQIKHRDFVLFAIAPRQGANVLYDTESVKREKNLVHLTLWINNPYAKVGLRSRLIRVVFNCTSHAHFVRQSWIFPQMNLKGKPVTTGIRSVAQDGGFVPDNSALLKKTEQKVCLESTPSHKESPLNWRVLDTGARDLTFFQAFWVQQYRAMFMLVYTNNPYESPQLGQSTGLAVAFRCKDQTYWPMATATWALQDRQGPLIGHQFNLLSPQMAFGPFSSDKTMRALSKVACSRKKVAAPTDLELVPQVFTRS